MNYLVHISPLDWVEMWEYHYAIDGEFILLLCKDHTEKQNIFSVWCGEATYLHSYLKKNHPYMNYRSVFTILPYFKKCFKKKPELK